MITPLITYEEIREAEIILARRHRCLDHSGAGSGPCKTDKERVRLLLPWVAKMIARRQGGQVAKIGKTVHYRSRGSKDDRFPPECRAALVAGLGNMEDELHLCVVNPTGIFFDHDVEYSERLDPGTWHSIEECETPEEGEAA